MAKKKRTKKFKDEFIAGIAKRAFERSVNWRGQKIEPRWVADNANYDSTFRNQKKTSEVLGSRSKLFIPKTYTHTQRMLVDLLETFFFDPDKIVDVVAWKNIPHEVRSIVSALMNYRLNGNPINFYQEAYECCLDALKNKVGIMKVNRGGIGKKFFPIMECVPYEDIFFSPEATWKDYYNFPIVHRMVKSLDYLKRRGYKNLDLVEQAHDETVTDEVKMQRANNQGSPFSGVGDTKIEDLSRILIYEIWTYLDIDGDGHLESVSVLMAGDASGPSIVIRDIAKNDLPFKFEGDDYSRPPFLVGSAFPEPHQMYGKSLPEIVEGLQKETNALRNQRRDAVALGLRAPVMVARSANINLASLVNRRIGGVVLGDDVSQSSVRELPISDATNGSIQEQVRTDQDFFEATSIPPDLLGAQTKGDDTATAVSSRVANASKKISLVIKSLAQTLFVPSFKYLLRLEQEYESDEMIKIVTGRILGWGFASDGLPAKDFIQGEFDLRAQVAINKKSEMNKWLLLSDRANIANQALAQLVSLGVAKPTDVKFINPMPLFKRKLELLGEKNIEEYQIQATQPSQAGGATGIASQPRQMGGGDSNVTSLNPTGTGG